jgi:hypothetical protein
MITITDIINKVDNNGNIIVTKIRKTYNGSTIIREDYLNNEDKFHRDGDLPARIRYYNDKTVSIEMWYQNGKKHRDNNLPAYIEYCNNIQYLSIWYKDGIKHRDNDLPAQVRIYPKSGRVNCYTWYENGIISRNDNPAFIVYFDVDGDIILQTIWYKNGEIHRDEDLPPYVTYDINGNIAYEEWHRNDEEHKINKDKKSVNIIDEISKFDEKKLIKCLEILKLMEK